MEIITCRDNGKYCYIYPENCLNILAIMKIFGFFQSLLAQEHKNYFYCYNQPYYKIFFTSPGETPWSILWLISTLPSTKITIPEALPSSNETVDHSRWQLNLLGEKNLLSINQCFAQSIWKEKGEKQLGKQAAAVLAIAVGFAVTVSAPDYLIYQTCRLQIKLSAFTHFKKKKLERLM